MALEENGDRLPIFFVENPDGSIDGVAGADSIAPPPANPRLWCHHCNTQLEFRHLHAQCSWSILCSVLPLQDDERSSDGEPAGRKNDEHALHSVWHLQSSSLGHSVRAVWTV
ncbi:Hypothetical protein SCF082_LOCUS18875 [Durusdinium trenchii]|uniref:Uncharacterized protein n=1 Tax=Durusdinium trenchii TaxID=1381693 RepID=A0ABP0KRW8_9DINO